MILSVEVAQAVPSAWRTLPSGLEERTIRVQLKNGRVLLGPGADKAGPARAGVAEIRQERWSSRVDWDVPSFWSHRDPRTGEKYLVFSSVPASVEQAFLQPLAVWELSEEPGLLQDVELVLASRALGPEAQEAQVLEVASRGGMHSGFFARYASAVALLARTSNRKSLLAWIGRLGDGALSERAKSELLRSVHSALTREQRPAPDALRALAAACLSTVAASQPEEASLTPRLESVVQVYLPWLAGSSPEWKTLARDALSPAERTKAAATLRWLAGLARFPEPQRDLLRQLAAALG